MRIIFMGSAEFACPAVEALRLSGHDLVACVTQPDRPKGRHLKLSPCPVKALAEARGIPVQTPERIAEPSALASVEALHADIIVVAAYGQYLPSRLLAMPRVACINIHPSLLPKYRGAAPIQWAVASGDTMTGVTILHVSKQMDAGDLIVQERYPIGDEDTAGSLEPKLAEFGAELLLRAIAQLEQGTAARVAQEEGQVTWARKLDKEDGRLDWSLPAETLRHHIRGFQPWPGAFTMIGNTRLKILVARVEPGSGEPGCVLEVGGEGPLVACGAQALRLLEVQPEGRPAMPGRAYVNGCPLVPGQLLPGKLPK